MQDSPSKTNHYEICIIKEKRKYGFTPKTSIRLANTIVKPLVYQKHRIDDSSARSFCIGWLDDILEEEAGFNNKPVNILEVGFTKSKGIPGFASKGRSNPKDEMIKNDARHHIYPLECPKPIFL